MVGQEGRKSQKVEMVKVVNSPTWTIPEHAETAIIDCAYASSKH